MPSFPRETHPMLKNFSEVPNLDVYIIIRLPPEQYCNSKVKI